MLLFQKPQKGGSRYFNYKKDNSIVLMAVVDADYCFSYIDVGAYGRESDGGVFSRSRFNDAIYDPSNPLGLPGAFNLPRTNLKSNHVFVADDAFRTSKFIFRLLCLFLFIANFLFRSSSSQTLRLVQFVDRMSSIQLSLIESATNRGKRFWNFIDEVANIPSSNYVRPEERRQSS